MVFQLQHLFSFQLMLLALVLLALAPTSLAFSITPTHYAIEAKLREWIFHYTTTYESTCRDDQIDSINVAKIVLLPSFVHPIQ